MIDLDKLKYIRMKKIEKLELMAIKEIEQLKQMKSEELNKNGKIKLEDIEHLEQIKLSQQEHFKKIKEEENKKISNMNNLKFNDIETYREFFSKLFNDFEIFSKNEIKNLELIEKDEIEQLGKITNEEIVQLKNLFIKEHQKFLFEENIEHFKYKGNFFKEFKKNEEERSKFPPCAGPPSNTNRYQNDIKIHVFFRIYNSDLNNEIGPFIDIECSLNDKIAQLIEKYNEKIGNISQNKKFIYQNNILSPDLTVREAYLTNGCLIKVING